jgi:hypothetical protein
MLSSTCLPWRSLKGAVIENNVDELRQILLFNEQTTLDPPGGDIYEVIFTITDDTHSKCLQELREALIRRGLNLPVSPKSLQSRKHSMKYDNVRVLEPLVTDSDALNYSDDENSSNRSGFKKHKSPNNKSSRTANSKSKISPNSSLEKNSKKRRK